MLIPPEEAPALVKEFLERSVRVVSLQLLVSVRRRAIRLGTWWRVDPFRRGLLEAAIAYLRRGFRFKSLKAMAMIKDALIEALTQLLIKSARFMAYIIGSRLITKLTQILGRALHITEVIALGLQWLNTPPMYRTGMING